MVNIRTGLAVRSVIVAQSIGGAQTGSANNGNGNGPGVNSGSAPGTNSGNGNSGNSQIDAMVSELVTLDPGTTSKQMLAAAEEAASTQGRPLDLVLQEAVTAMRADQVEEQTYEAAVIPYSSSAGEGSVALGTALNRGDVFYSPATIAGYTSGHSGIYYSKTDVIEAPGPFKTARNTSYTNVTVASGTQKQSVSTTQANRDTAANLANRYVGVGYNLNFAFNKTASTALGFNCSQLVWVAYKDGVGIDLDSDGGTGVLPSDIRDSPWTVTYQTIY